MSPETFFILVLSTLVALACSLLGVFLVLRKVSLLSDAISHAILFGIVIGFFIVPDLHSPILIIMATLAGILTVTLTELLIKTKKVKEDASIGLVFPFLFAIAVVLLTKFASNVHLDEDAVIKGNLVITVFDRVPVFGVEIPVSILVMSLILLVDILFVVLFYKELQLVIFDRGLAVALGFVPGVLYYSLMTLVSVTAVGAFDAVGSILVVALMIAPPATAYLLTHKLSRMIQLSLVFGGLSALSGYWVAMTLDASISGSMAMMSGVFFGLVFIFAPERGLVAQYFSHEQKKLVFSSHLLLVHLLDHEGSKDEKQENTVANAVHHMRWTPEQASRIVDYSIEHQWVLHNRSVLKLTSLGREVAKQVMVRT